MQSTSQRELPFESRKEQERLQRVERLLGGDVGQHVRPASELMFTEKAFTEATRIATSYNMPEKDAGR